MISFKPAYALAIAVISTAALSQQASQTPVPASAPPSATYESAFDNYRPFTEVTVKPWQATNETAREAGGWRAYANEAHGRGTGHAASAASRPAAQKPERGHQR